MGIGFNIGLRALPTWLLLPALLCILACAPVMADNQIAIGIIQYNAKGKGSTGGWTNADGSIGKQLTLLADKINDAANAAPVQFIALEQATDPVVSDRLASDKGIKGWRTVAGGCKGENGGKVYTEGTQIGYSPDWELVPNTNPVKKNPLANTFKSSNCFSPGRPYNIAYFQQKNTPNMKVLFVVIHPPHCYGYTGDLKYLAGCLEEYFTEFTNFDAESLSVTGAKTLGDLKDINTVIAGDTNELGNAGVDFNACPPYPGDGAGYELLFSHFGKLSVSTVKTMVCSTVSTDHNGTCCNDNDWSSHFDRIVTNASAVEPWATIIKTGAYPLFQDPTPGAKRDEEHKAIYGVVTFPAPK